MTQSNKRITASIVILLILSGLAYVIITKHTDTFAQSEIGTIGTSSTDTAATNPANTANTTSQGDGTNKPPVATTASVSLAENVTGQLMKVNSVVLPVAGYVALYNVNTEGDVTLVGHSDVLPAGVSYNVTIQTKQPMVYNQALVAVLYADTNGDKVATAMLPDMVIRAGGVIVTDIDIIDQDSTRETPDMLAKVNARIEANMK